MYTPPDFVLVSFANSAFASKSFFSPPSLFFSNFSSSMAAMRAANCRSRSARRAGSTSLTLGSSTRRPEPEGDADLRRLEGGCSEFSGERDLHCIINAGSSAEESMYIPLALLVRTVRGIRRRETCHSSHE